MTKLQTRFSIRKRQYFEKRFLPAYSTALRAPETRKGKKYFFETLLDGPLYSSIVGCIIGVIMVPFKVSHLLNTYVT